MKRLLICLVTMVCLLGTVGVAYGNSGNTITTFGSTTNSAYYLDISNITNNPVNVKIILYKQDGTIIKDDGSFGNDIIQPSYVSDYNDNVTDATAVYTLGANSTGRIRLLTNQHVTGYGVIEWTQDSKTPCALVAYSFIYATGQGFNSIPINNGQPF